MDLGSFNKPSLGFPHQSPPLVPNVDVDFTEIYFLILHFLSAGPCQTTFTHLCNDLMESNLLPKRYHAFYSRNGDQPLPLPLSLPQTHDANISLPLTYQAAAQRYSHIQKDHLVKLLKQLLLDVAPSRGLHHGTTPPTAAHVPTLLGIGPFSLLPENKGDAKGVPGYLRWPHMQADQVRAIALREIGGGFPKHHRAPSIRFPCYAIAKPSTMVQKMQNIKKLRGHRDAVYCAIFDRSGRYVITGSDDRLVKIWSMETAFCLSSCRGHEGDITDLAVNFNNTLVASASNDFNIRVWRLPDGLPISVLRGHVGAVTAIAFSPKHSSVFHLLSSSDDGSCRIWDARYSQCRPRVYVPRQTDGGSNNVPSSSNNNNPPPQNNHQILCCAYNANGTAFVTGSSDTFARVWSACKPNIDDSQLPTHEIDVLAGHENDVNYVQFSGCAVASRSFSSETSTDEKVPKLKTSWYGHDNIVTCSRDGSAIIWIPRSRRSHGKGGRWTRAYHLKVPPPPMAAQPRPRQRFLPTPRGVNMIVWSLDNRFVLAAIMDCRICVWNASDGRLVHSLTGHTQSTYVLDVHPFNPRIAMSSGYDGKTIIWDIWEGIPIRIYEIGRYKLVDGKFSPDGTSIVLSDEGGQIYLLNTGQGESQKDSKYDQFFLGDYRPLAMDAHGNAIDQETQLAPYRRNIQDALCDSSMLPYPEPYQSDFQRRRLGALNLEWRPPSIKFAIGTDIGLGQEFHILPLADLDEPPLPEFLFDAMLWEPENDVIPVDSTDSEYNVTDDCSSDDEQEANTSADDDAANNTLGTAGDDDSRRRSKRKKPKDLEWTTASSGRRVKKRNDGTSSKRRKKSNRKVTTPLRPQRASARKFISQGNGYDDLSEEEEEEEVVVEEEEAEDDLTESSEAYIEEDEKASTVDEVVPPDSRRKLVLKFSIPKKNKSPEFKEAPAAPVSEENGVEEIRSKKPTIIRIKAKTKVNCEGDVNLRGECSGTKQEADDNKASQKRKTIKFKFNQHGDGQMVPTEGDALKLKGFCEKSSSSPKNQSKKSDSGRSNWLLLGAQEEGFRYIPQLGDEVAYLRQGHEEYIREGSQSSGGVPWKLYGGKNIRDVEICSVDEVNYDTHAGSGESCCKLKLRFMDEESKVCGKSFNLTLPELLNFPDFLVERRRYKASLERVWSEGDACWVWWRDILGGGNWWEGRVVSMGDKSLEFPGSPWDRYTVEYDDGEPCRHSPWELHHQTPEFDQPGIHPRITKIMLSLLSKLHHSSQYQDKFGIRKLKQASERLDFINKFPAPLTLEIIELRLNNMYYRSFQAINHDIMVVLDNARAHFGNNAEMSPKIARLSDWFQRKFSDLSFT